MNVDLVQLAGSRGRLSGTSVDPVTAEVVRGVMETICFEMATYVSRTATTPILNQSNERNATVLDARGRLLEDQQRAVVRFALQGGAGADIIFVDLGYSADVVMEELRIIAEQIAAYVPCAANMTENCGRPLLTTDELFRMGFKVILYPLTALMTAAAALESTFTELNSQGTTRRITERMWPPTKFKRLIGADDLLALRADLEKAG